MSTFGARQVAARRKAGKLTRAEPAVQVATARGRGRSAANATPMAPRLCINFAMFGYFLNMH
eukprot:CAMPEP_0178397154 /NCGR_PEP_ID=MMETSP0689_2-20121128/14098_1 /TAXON_ID=160604 /ORGANISM="Amphidinium massartii, Strain CS-259" /LENGTH=61 /DNA_ID=CAMNT_0020017851 /DNA_START=107 /DNA_END=292 /DNA_ORIENTATION=+